MPQKCAISTWKCKKIFLGGGTDPSPVGVDTPSPHRTHLGACGASTLAPSALDFPPNVIPGSAYVLHLSNIDFKFWHFYASRIHARLFCCNLPLEVLLHSGSLLGPLGPRAPCIAGSAGAVELMKHQTGDKPLSPVWCFIFWSSWRSLLLEARFLAWNSPNTVWRQGSARTRWGEPLAAIRGLLLRELGLGERREREGV